MIEIRHVTKCFDSIKALNDVTFTIPKGRIFGLLGTNGAGKSTLLRAMAGILACDAGEILIEGEACYDNPQGKERFFYLPDDPYYFPNATMETMTDFYRRQYPGMEPEAVEYMAERLELDARRPLRTFSKGMKRQAFLILALCANTDYLLCDEVFDGLDPVVTEVMKDLFLREMKEQDRTVVVAAHKLKDLEEFCQDIAILHKGGMLLAGDMRRKEGEVYKIQCVFDGEMHEKAEELLHSYLDVVKFRQEGYFTTLIVKGQKAEILGQIQKRNPVFCREVPMTLQEVFLAEMEGSGYDVGKVFQ